MKEMENGWLKQGVDLNGMKEKKIINLISMEWALKKNEVLLEIVKRDTCLKLFKLWNLKVDTENIAEVVNRAGYHGRFEAEFIGRGNRKRCEVVKVWITLTDDDELHEMQIEHRPSLDRNRWILVKFGEEDGNFGMTDLSELSVFSGNYEEEKAKEDQERFLKGSKKVREHLESGRVMELLKTHNLEVLEIDERAEQYDEHGSFGVCFVGKYKGGPDCYGYAKVEIWGWIDDIDRLTCLQIRRWDKENNMVDTGYTFQGNAGPPTHMLLKRRL